MVILRCTAKALRHIRKSPIPNLTHGSSVLGDWYLNVVPTAGGEFMLFVNEQSLLTVAVPAAVGSVFQLFVRRVANILAMLGIANHLIERELDHFDEVKIGKASSRVVLGSMTDIAFQLQHALEAANPSRPLSLSDFEFSISEMPCGPLGYSTPGKVAAELIRSGLGGAA